MVGINAPRTNAIKNVSQKPKYVVCASMYVCECNKKHASKS